MDYRVEKNAKKYAPTYKSTITCKFEDCPLFSVCPQFQTSGTLYNQDKANLMFLFDNPSQEDVAYSVPAISEAGMLFRTVWLEPFLGAMGTPMPAYVISYLIRTPLDREPTTSEQAYCWDHFYTDLMKHRPRTIVGFGSNIFSHLYRKAKNKEKLPDPDSSVAKLRQEPMDIQLADDYTAKLFIGYAPGYIANSPHSRSEFRDDRDKVIGYLRPDKKVVEDRPDISIDVKLIKTVDEALKFIDDLTHGLPKDQFFDLAFDTETENLNRSFNNKFLSWQFSWEPNHAVFIPIEHPEMPLFAKIEDKVKLIAAFQKLLDSSPEESRISWIVAHNAKFDLSILYGLFRILPRGTIPVWDTLLGMHWLDENRKSKVTIEGKPYSLKTLGKELLYFTYKSEQLAARADGDLVSLSFNELKDYGGTDAILTWHLKQKQMRLANLQPDNALPKLERFMRHYYSPASRAVAFMECNGLHVSKEQLHYLQGENSPIWNRIVRIENVELQESPEVLAFREEHKKTLQGESSVAYEEDLWGDTEESSDIALFNPNKKDQENAFYLDFLGLEPLALSKKTKKPTLNKAFLNHYADPKVYKALGCIKPYVKYYETPIKEDEEGEPVFPKNPLQLILEYRELTKLGNTYLESISEMIEDKKGDCIDSRVRASYWLSGTDTGRLCLRFDSRISVVGDYAKSNLTPPIPPVKHGIYIKDVKIGDLVFCYDDEGNLQIRKVLWQGKTGTKKLLRLHWSAGNGRKTSHLDLTPEHKVRLLDGSYKMAKDLKPDDRLLTMARCVVKTNSNKKNYYSKIYTQKTMLNEHRFIYEKVNGSKAQTVHHADGNSLNNHPSNLVATTTSKHTTEHLKEHWEKGVFENRPTKGEGHYLWNHQGKFTFLKELAKVQGHRKSKAGLGNKNLIKNSESFKKRCTLFDIDPKVVRMRYDGQGVYISKGRLQRLFAISKSAEVLSDLKIDYRTLKALLSYYGLEHLVTQRNREGSEARKHSVLRNHVVVKIEELPGFHDVYDLEVEDCHNFIANEICVHNSSSNPNLQNLPAGRSKMAKEIKNLFQAEPPSKRFKQGTALVQLDYKTAEVRWAAIFAKDSNLIRLFNEAHDSLVKACSPDVVMTNEEFDLTQLASDIHRRTASLMFGVEPAKVSKAQRQASKCLVGSTRLFTNQGIIPIESLVQDKNDNTWQQRIHGVSTASHQEQTTIVGVNHKWVDATIRLHTKVGIKIEGDYEHQLLVWQDCQLVKKKLVDIKVGDYLVFPRTNDVWASQSPVITAYIPNAMDTDLVNTVTCLVCGEPHGNLNRHLPCHGLNTQSYRSLYPEAALVSPAQIAKRMNTLLGTQYNIDVPKYPTTLTPALAKILGYLVAEGDGQIYTMSGHADESQDMLQDFIQCFQECFGLSLAVSTYREFTNTGVIRLPQKVVRYLIEVGLIQGYSETQRVPDIMFRATKEEITAFLSAYFEGDGSVKDNGIVVTSASPLLMEDVQLLLLSLNILATQFEEERVTPVGKEVRVYYGLRLNIRDARLFQKQIGFVSERKQGQLEKISPLSSGRDYLYGLESLLTKLKLVHKVGRRWVVNGTQVRFGERITKGGMSEITHERLATRPYVMEALRVWSNTTGNTVYQDVAWLHKNRAALIPVTDRLQVEGKTKVYDIEVSDDKHLFLANGLLSQNCITFGLIYGMGVQTLAANNCWTEKDAQDKVDMFFAAFPELKRWLDSVPEGAKHLGYVETKMGRRRRLSDLFESPDFKDRAKASRLAMNAPIQGQSSDGGTIGLFTFLQFLLDNKLERRWIVQNVVHDSCLIQVPIEDIEKALAAMQHYFVQGMADYIRDFFGYALPLPIECEIEVGLKYGDLTKWDGRPSTLPTLIEKIKSDAKELWYTKKEQSGKPPENMDLVPWDGK